MALTYTALADIQFDMGPYILNRQGRKVSQSASSESVCLSPKDVYE